MTETTAETINADGQVYVLQDDWRDRFNDHIQWWVGDTSTVPDIEITHGIVKAVVTPESWQAFRTATSALGGHHAHRVKAIVLLRG